MGADLESEWMVSSACGAFTVCGLTSLTAFSTTRKIFATRITCAGCGAPPERGHEFCSYCGIPPTYRESHA